MKSVWKPIIRELITTGNRDVADKLSEILSSNISELSYLINEARRSIQHIDELFDSGESIDKYYTILKSFVKDTSKIKDPDLVIANKNINSIT